MTNTLLSLGIALTVGLAGAHLLNKFKLPSVTAYIVFGIILGPYLLNLVSADTLRTSG